MARKSIYDRFQSGYVPGRDASDYARRMYRGYVRGLSPAQARGHARREKGELPVSALTRQDFEAIRQTTIIRDLVVEYKDTQEFPNANIQHTIYQISIEQTEYVGDIVEQYRGNNDSVFLRVIGPDNKQPQTVVFDANSPAGFQRLVDEFMVQARRSLKLNQDDMEELEYELVFVEGM